MICKACESTNVTMKEAHIPDQSGEGAGVGSTLREYTCNNCGRTWDDGFGSGPVGGAFSAVAVGASAVAFASAAVFAAPIIVIAAPIVGVAVLCARIFREIKGN
jgi:hypothetical protein